MDLQPVIIEYLCRQRALSLPGLGTLRWLEHNPRRSSDLIFKGATFSLHHSSKEGVPTDFINYLAKKANVAKEHSSSIVEEWCSAVLAKLSASEAVKIGGLGTFLQEDNKVVFKADQIALQQGGDLSLSIATRDRIQPEGKMVSSEIKSDFSIWDILLPIILIALIALLAFSLWKSLKPAGSPDPDPATAINKVEETLDNEDEVASMDSLDQAAVQDTVDGARGQGISEDDPELDAEDVDDIGDMEEEDVVVDENEDAVQETDYIEESVENGQEGKIVSRANEGECIVIIGSFKRDDLAELAVQKVVDRGLKAYTEDYREFTRVGVVFDCETQDLYRRLFQLRGDFGEDAWILKYK